MGWFRWRRRSRRDITVVNDETGLSFFRFFGGRRHLTGVPYALPKDDQELNRLDFQHYLLRFALRGNYAAPINNPHDILDVGCGSGRWPLEMAQLFPEANVVGVDLVPPPVDSAPNQYARPANYVFVTGNVLEGLPFGDASFDFAHQRLLISALPSDQWPSVVHELIRVTRRGGWVELVEGDIKAAHGGPALERIGAWIYEAVGRRGIDVSMCRQIGELLRQGGLARVEQREIRLPLGRRFGRVGGMMETNFLALFEGVKGLVVAMGITTQEIFEQTMREAVAEMQRGSPAAVLYIAYGQRVS
jgi:ubiquinone/menaquinone biosynthesis C-methylase UbiE